MQGERVPLARVEQVIDARYLGLLERERSKDLMIAGLSIRKIAAAMGRAPSTISCELRRNTVSRSGYLRHTAHRVSVKRRERPRRAKALAQQITKDPYVLDFLALDGDAQERHLEQALVDRIIDTLRELGEGFAFVGRQVHFDVDGDDFYVDLLFFHVEQLRYVVIELDLPAVDLDPGGARITEQLLKTRSRTSPLP